MEASQKDINHQDAFGNTALMIAANNGQLDRVRELVEAKADVNLQDKYGQSALIYAAFGNYLDVVQYLLKHGANMDIQVRCKCIVLLSFGCVFGARHSLTLAANIMCHFYCLTALPQTKFGQTAMMKAAFSNSHHIVSALLGRRANVDLQATDGRTALMIASQTNNLKVVEDLVEQAGADVNRQDATGKTAAMLAAENGCFMVVTYLARAGCDTNIRDHEGHTLFDMVDKTSGQGQEVTRMKLEQAVARGLQAARDSELAKAAAKAEEEAANAEESMA